MPETRSQAQANVEAEVEPYKLSEIFSLIPEFEGDQISLGTFLNSCDCAYKMATTEQRLLLVIHIKNKLKGRAAQLINSRNPSTYLEIKQLLNLHFGDSRDLTSLIQDLQRLRQLPGESALTFYNRLQVLNAKMHASIHKGNNLTNDQKAAQTNLIETMALNTLLTGLEPRLGQIIRAGNPRDLLEAHSRIRRELQLSYFETQKSSRPVVPSSKVSQPIRKPPSQQIKCRNCGRLGHISTECRSQPTQYPSTSQSYPRQYFPQQGNFSSNPSQQTKPSPFQTYQRQPSSFQQANSTHRPPVIQRNNFAQNQSRTHHMNYDEHQEYEEASYPETSHIYDDFNEQTYEDNSNQPIHGEEYENFSPLPLTNHPPNYLTQTEDTSQLEAQIQSLNIDDLDPNLNFPEQTFL